MGFLGPGPLEVHVDHAAGFGSAIEAWRPAAAGGVAVRAADLGSGGGLPGLPLALHFAGWRWTLVEAGSRRAAFLREVVLALGLADRVEVAAERAEVVGRAPEHRGRYDVVVARGFGPPAVAAECAAPLLGPGGQAVVSEPPGGQAERWPHQGLDLLGLESAATVTASGAAFQVLRSVRPCPDRYPRRVGVPAKRPLF